MLLKGASRRYSPLAASWVLAVLLAASLPPFAVLQWLPALLVWPRKLARWSRIRDVPVFRVPVLIRIRRWVSLCPSEALTLQSRSVKSAAASRSSSGVTGSNASILHSRVEAVMRTSSKQKSSASHKDNNRTLCCMFGGMA